MAKKVTVKKSPVATKPARAMASAKVAAKPVGKAVKAVTSVKLKPSGLKATSVKASALKSGGAKGKKRGGASAPLGEGVPASWLQVMRVMGNALITSNALITTEKKKLTLDAGVARAVAAPLFPGDKPAASAFIKLLQTAVKDLEKSAALSAMTTPLL